jgi:hypothetical protein
MREMQQCFMFIDTGNGWTPVNDSTKDVAALDSFTIDWGSDGIRPSCRSPSATAPDGSQARH